MKYDDLIANQPYGFHDIVLVEDLPLADRNDGTPKPSRSHVVLTNGKRVPADFTAREFASRYGWVYLRADRLALSRTRPFGLAPPSSQQQAHDTKRFRSLLTWTDYSARMHVKPLLT